MIMTFFCQKASYNFPYYTTFRVTASISTLQINTREYVTLVYQEKMRGQRGRLPVQALGYVNSTKVIFGLPKTAGVRFRLSRYMMIRLFRNGDPRGNTLCR